MSITHNECPLCCPHAGDILLDSHNFYLMTSKSMGDALIIPKGHYLTMADLPEEIIIEFEEMRSLVRRMLKADFGSCVFYEHTGQGLAWAFVGHGDGHGHAHLHCASTSNGFLANLPETYVPREVQSWKQVLESRRGGEHYFYFEDKNDRKFVILATNGGKALTQDIMK
jgi:diadenosine tetraphosphate (Ap4A) HIT family hydrolase